MTAGKSCPVCGTEFDSNQKFCPNDGTPLRSSSESTDPLVGQVIADRYRIVSKIGEGGMGRVYLAEHVRMGRKCAVKMISPELARTEAAVARFNREAANASQINHPNVAQVYDFGEGPDGALYLAMEFVDGVTMTALVQREGTLPVRRAAMLTRQAAEALSAAHHLGIVHRDLKPDNILVARQHDGSECVKVVDFGIAKTVHPDGSDSGTGQTLTAVGVSAGTPEYMSPEQLAGERLDGRSDVYALGLVFFNLLTADLPHPRVTSRETLIHRLTEPPRTLVETRPGTRWPQMLQPMLDWALATDREKRYPTAQEFALDLSILTAQPFDSAAPMETVQSGEVVSQSAQTVADARLSRGPDSGSN
jgi:eukaryotic-like serine/threonine-protein kinase